MYKQYYKNIVALLFSDFLLTFFTFILIGFLRPFLPGEELAASDVVPHVSMYLWIPFSMVLVFSATGVYNFRAIPRPGGQARDLVSAYAIWGWFLVGALYFTFRETSRLFIVYFGIANLIVLMISRYCIWRLLELSPKTSHAAKVVIFGSNPGVSTLCSMILKDLPAGFELIGVSDFNKSPVDGDGPTFLGTAEELPDIIREKGIDIVIISLDQNSLESVNSLIIKLLSIPVRVLLAHDYSKLPCLKPEIERIEDVVIVGLLEPIINGWNRLIKRIFDISVSLISLLILWPVLILIALAIRLETSGSVIFKAKRIGNGGKPFTMYKFRTMFEIGPEPIETPIDSNAPEQNVYKLKDDSRVTPLGKILRRWSLDELPQLFNVLKGDMSMVGPRPEQPFITKHYEPWQWQRIQAPPGITGWWQIHGRSELPMHKNTHLDIYHIANYSILLDMKILLLTIFEVIKGRGAY